MSSVLVAGAIAGGALIGGYMNQQAAQGAAQTAADASNRASNIQRDIYLQQRADQEPWRRTGIKALTQMENPEYYRNFSMADYQADPGYQFRLAEGQKAIDAAMAARGMGGSGAALKALTKYGQNMASEEYGKAYDRFNNDRNLTFNRLASRAGTGQTAANNVGAAGQNMANGVSNNLMGAANASAAAQMQTANGWNNALGTGVNSWMNYNMMNRLFPEKQSGVDSAGPSIGNARYGQQAIPE